jgi:hypothetical protein
MIEQPKNSKWTNIGHAGDYKVWISLDDGRDDAPTNIYQCTHGAQPPPSDSYGGYPVLASLLSAKGILEKFVPNEFALPEGWLCASGYTKRCVGEDVLYEATMGDQAKGEAQYDMTIAYRNSAFLPIHGNALLHTDGLRAARDAAQALKTFWEALPDDRRLLAALPARERSTG